MPPQKMKVAKMTYVNPCRKLVAMEKPDDESKEA
jgi:hypothetical protein